MLVNSSQINFLKKNKWATLLVQLTLILCIIGFVCNYNPISTDLSIEHQGYKNIPNAFKAVLKDKEWLFDNAIYKLDTEMQIPGYFMGKSAKPIKPPFDPRLTLAFYYDYISHNAKSLEPIELPFHWSDWVDMTTLDTFIYLTNKLNKTCASLDQRPYQEKHFPGSDQESYRLGSQDPDTFCREVPNDANGVGFEIYGFPGRMTEEMAAVMGKAYLFTLAPNPVSMVLLSKNGTYHFPLSSNKESLLTGKMVPEFFKRNLNAKKINTLDKFKELQHNLKADSMSVIHSHEVHLSHENFIFNPIEELALFEDKRSKSNLSHREKMYADALKTSLECGDSPEKYFAEAQVFDTQLSDHYDWRFFSGFEHFTENSINSISRLTRVWLSFARKEGLNTWLAHGTLLSWESNGLNFPWDYDADVQMPIQDLQRLSLKFNQSLIVEDSEDGFGRYFLDCGTYITTRTNANGNNNIDARFIDVDTGFYVDITGLAVTAEKPPSRYNEQIDDLWFEDSQGEVNDQLQLYNCRNFHFASHSELSPLKKTLFEGEIGYIPNGYKALLLNEYSPSALTDHHYGGAFFVPRLRLWISVDPVRFFLRFKEKWHQYFGVNRQKTRKEVGDIVITGDLNKNEESEIDNWNEKDIEEFLLNEDILIKYLHSRNVTLVHQAEMTLYSQEELTEELLRVQPHHLSIKYEPFLYRMHMAKETFELRVASYVHKSKGMKLHK